MSIDGPVKGCGCDCPMVVGVLPVKVGWFGDGPSRSDRTAMCKSCLLARKARKDGFVVLQLGGLAGWSRGGWQFEVNVAVSVRHS